MVVEERDAIPSLGIYEGKTAVWQNSSGSFVRGEPPKYTTSFDAMALAEATLTRHECHAFNAFLMDLKPLRCGRTCEADHWSWHATAAQRAEAFLRVKNLWID